MNEEAVLFGREGGLAGIVTLPAPTGHRLPAVLLLNAGKLSRVGPNRLYVGLARRLAALGFPVLRFDFSGIGESRPRSDALPPVAAAVAEVREAMDYLAATRGAERFLLMGFCSGATFSLLASLADDRVAGIGLVNLHGGRPRRAIALRAYVHKGLRYYWRVVLSHPRLALKPAGRLTRRPAAPAPRRPRGGWSSAETVDALRSLSDRGVRVLFLYSESDIGLDVLRATVGRALDRLVAEEAIELEVIRSADHVFTLLDHQEDLFGTLERWVDRHYLRALPPVSRAPVTVEADASLAAVKG